ncbi:MAG TPA: ATP-dependent helicase [Candidatus Eisenbergiella intestinipullorum]|nr:ATP-dependent helicase [Candidatus Eisenbergiella intestinipullorum]
MADPGQSNPGQASAISHRDGPMLVLAGPGSGKTYTITQRIRCLIEEGGAEPESILVITFTRAAADEMKSRFFRLTEGKFYPVNFGTFHAVYYHILKNAYHYHSGNILSEHEKRELLKTVLLRTNGLPCLEDEEAEMLLNQISRYKNDGCPADVSKSLGDTCALRPEQFAFLYQAYSREARERRKLDFDDMVLGCRELFLQYPAVLAAWQKKFRYILVDEFQDINAMQYEVLRMLALPENNLFVVGDDDQSIYAFRGARPELMLNFERDYPDAKRVELSVNYRSTPEILSCAGKLIRVNKNRFEKKSRAASGHGEAVRFLGFEDREAQNERIAQELLKAGEERGSSAVIFRTNRDAGELAELLLKKGVPFWMKEKLKSPYRGRAAADLRAYLSFAFGGQKRSDFLRIMNRPKRYLSRSALDLEQVDLERLKARYRDKPYMQEILRKLQMDLARLRRMDLYAAVNYIRRGMGYEEYLKQAAMEEHLSLKELRAQADWFQKQVKEYAVLEDLEEHILFFERELESAAAKRPGADCVSLLTMHASKGLEYDTVYLPDCNEGIIPHKKSMRGEEVEEERRMFYVAMTRARKRLTLSWVAGTKEEPGFLSRFLSDLEV